MRQLALGEAIPEPPFDLEAELLGGRPGLRWYQEEAVDAALRELRENDSTLLLFATGTGKTQIFCHVANEWNDGDVLVLAHRDELVDQAVARLEQIVGGYIDVEKADSMCSPRSRIVVGSTQTVTQPKRLERLGKDRFSLIICDEAHHYTAPTYKRVLDWFSGAKRLLVTATADRSDEQALGQICDSVAMVYDIQQGIEDGFLVPLVGEVRYLKEIDLSGVNAAAGDLVRAQLDEAMAKAAAGIVTETMKAHPDRTGIFFFPGVRSASLACEVANKASPGCACFISGETDKEERRIIVEDFRRGRYRYMMNCQIATEGFDAPVADMVVFGRPTKSRALHAQMAGRGTRVLPGVVDGLNSKEDADERRRRIAASAKPNCLLLDFVGNCGKHQLTTPLEVLGGNFEPAVIQQAKKKLEENPGGDMLKMLREAQAEIKALAQRAEVKSSSTANTFDPFATLDIEDEGVVTTRFGKKPITEKQYATLAAAWPKHASKDALANMSRREASVLIERIIFNRQNGLASLKQLAALKQHGVEIPGLPFKNATELLDYIYATRRAKQELDHLKIQAIAGRV